MEQAEAEIRPHQVAPLFKLYIINDQDVFFGFPPIREYEPQVGGQRRVIYDLMGKDAMIFHHSAGGDAGREYIERSRPWFESMRHAISREYTR